MTYYRGTAGKPVPVKIVCPHCGSDNVHKDAAAAWCAETQAWELSSTHDSETCNDCGREGDWFADRRPVDDAGELPIGDGHLFRWMIQGERTPELWAWLERDGAIVDGTAGFYRTTDPNQALERMREHVPAAFAFEREAAQ